MFKIPSTPFTQRGRLIRKQQPKTAASLLLDWFEQVQEQTKNEPAELELGSPLVTGLLTWLMLPDVHAALKAQLENDVAFAKFWPVPVVTIPLEDLEMFRDVFHDQLKLVPSGHAEQDLETAYKKAVEYAGPMTDPGRSVR